MNERISQEEKLNSARSYLKNLFFGIDEQIDLLIDSLYVWYVMPEIITRPVVINLWGLTGVGKTDLVRKLVDFLDLRERFTEITLTNGDAGYNRYMSTVAEAIRITSVDPSQPNIIFFDEIQKFRTIDQEGKDIFETKFGDFWELLSDGKFAVKDSVMELYSILSMLDSERESEERAKAAGEAPPKLRLSSWDLSKLKNVVDLPLDIEVIKTFTASTLYDLVFEKFSTKSVLKEADFSKSLVIISGNLDEAYEMAAEADQADVDADIFHAQTKQINVIKIKEALSLRFKPEQISRLGNTHIIYPSLSESAYKRIISERLKKIAEKISESFRVEVSFDQTIHNLIYKNGVFPVQGTRPLFSTITEIVENKVAMILAQALKINVNTIHLSYNEKAQQIVGKDNSDSVFSEISYQGTLDRIRTSKSEIYRKVTAIHEAAHAVLYSELFKIAPMQVVVNSSSNSISGFVFPHQIVNIKENVKKKLIVLYAGMAAEKLFMGEEKVSAGSQSDIERATSLIANYIRKFGLDDRVNTSVKPVTEMHSENYDTDFEKTNSYLQEMASESKWEAEKLVGEHKSLIQSFADELLRNKEMKAEQTFNFLKDHIQDLRLENEDYEISY